MQLQQQAPPLAMNLGMAGLAVQNDSEARASNRGRHDIKPAVAGDQGAAQEVAVPLEYTLHNVKAVHIDASQGRILLSGWIQLRQLVTQQVMLGALHEALLHGRLCSRES